eukprot:8831950-Pyramimonas_sp.AAC.1
MATRWGTHMAMTVVMYVKLTHSSPGSGAVGVDGMGIRVDGMGVATQVCARLTWASPMWASGRGSGAAGPSATSVRQQGQPARSPISNCTFKAMTVRSDSILLRTQQGNESSCSAGMDTIVTVGRPPIPSTLMPIPSTLILIPSTLMPIPSTPDSLWG